MSAGHGNHFSSTKFQYMSRTELLTFQAFAIGHRTLSY